MSEPLADCALRYEQLGFFVLPILPKTKQPFVKWAYRKERRPDAAEITNWWVKYPDANVGIATGKHSDVDVVDLDGPQAQDRFENLFGTPETIMQKSGRADGGIHLWFKHNGHNLRNSTGKEENKGIDFKTTGGIAVVAPSVHATGNLYEFININPLEHGLDDLQELPPDVIEFFSRQNGDGDKKPLTLEPVENGQRNDTLARLVGKWINQGSDIKTAKLTAIGWNSSLPEPLDEKEVRTTVESIFKTHERNHPESPMINTGKTSLEFPHEVMTGAAGDFADVYSECIEPKSFDNLTAKEQKFALEVAKGKNRTQAAMASHECTSLASAKSMGSQLLSKPDIQTAVSEIMQLHGLTRSYRVLKLKQHIENVDPSFRASGGTVQATARRSRVPW